MSRADGIPSEIRATLRFKNQLHFIGSFYIRIIMLRGILLILATLFAVFIISGIIYTKIFGPIGGAPTASTPPVVTASPK
jgi:hypothetical protein